MPTKLSAGCLPEREAHPGGKLQHGAVHWGPGHCHDTQGSYFHLISLQKFKGTVSRDFLLLVFSWISLSPAPEYPIRTVLALMVYSGAWGKLIHAKNRSRKSRDTVPLKPTSWILIVWRCCPTCCADCRSLPWRRPCL